MSCKTHIVIHCKHKGCFEVCKSDEFGPITTLNPPVVYFFNSKEKAILFFDEYIENVCCLHPRCIQGKKEKEKGEGEERCGMIYTDDDEPNSIRYYTDHTNQIYILEESSQMYTPCLTTLKGIKCINKINRQKKMCKTFGQEEKQQLIELGKMCEDSF
jgi:hypothetical protein